MHPQHCHLLILKSVARAILSHASCSAWLKETKQLFFFSPDAGKYRFKAKDWASHCQLQLSIVTGTLLVCDRTLLVTTLPGDSHALFISFTARHRGKRLEMLLQNIRSGIYIGFCTYTN